MSPPSSDTDLITFTPTETVSPPHPTPAAQETPYWLENLSRNAEGIKAFRNSSVKMCMPFNDAVGIGWIMYSPVTMHFSRDTETGALHVDVEDEDSTTDQGPVTVLSDTPPRHDENSSFATPDCLVETGWEITAPEGTSLLFTEPLNRAELRFTPASLLVEVDSYSGSINLPLVLPGESATIERGDILTQVIPISRHNRLETPELKTYTPDSDAGRLKQTITNTVDARSGFYRRDMWVKKPGFQVISDKDDLNKAAASQSPPTTAPAQISDSEPQSPRSFLGEGTDQAFYCRAALDGEIPEPVPAADRIPPGHFDEMRHRTAIDAEQPTTDWMEAAMSLGTIFPLGIDIHLHRNDAMGLEVSALDEQLYHKMSPKKIGDDHPFTPLTPVNLIGQWAPVLKHGYSNLYIQPLNHFQQYYHSFAGIVESDRYFSTVNVPGLLSPRVSEITLPRGMPVSQAIPLHRQSLITTAYIND